MHNATVQSKMQQMDRYKEKRAYILERVHDGSLSNMDADMQLYSSGLASPHPSSTTTATGFPLGSLGWSGSIHENPVLPIANGLDAPTKSHAAAHRKQ